MSGNYQAKNLLVTGGAGFIGSNFIHYMLANNPHVSIINLDLLTYAGSKDNLTGLADPERHHFIQGNICDSDLVSDILLQYDIDTIVHFAAESHVDRSITGPAEFIQTNIVGTFTLLESARLIWLGKQKRNEHQCRFHHISTDEVYGSLDKDSHPFSEAHAYLPNSPYSASKASSDHLVRAYYQTYGLPMTTSNCSNNYGPYQHQEKLIPTIIHACLNSEAIPIYGNGTNVRDWLYVEDHCRGIDKILSHGTIGETYNIGGDCEWHNIDLAKYICQLMDKLNPDNAPHEQLIQLVQDRAGHDFRYAIDAKKMKDELGWVPMESIESGLNKTLQFILSTHNVSISTY